MESGSNICALVIHVGDPEGIPGFQINLAQTWMLQQFEEQEVLYSYPLMLFACQMFL